MKKLILYFTIFISLFYVVDNIKAQTQHKVVFNYSSDYVNTNYNYIGGNEFINEVINYIDSKNINNYGYFIYLYHSDSIKKQYSVIVTMYNKKENYNYFFRPRFKGSNYNNGSGLYETTDSINKEVSSGTEVDVKMITVYDSVNTACVNEIDNYKERIDNFFNSPSFASTALNFLYLPKGDSNHDYEMYLEYKPYESNYLLLYSNSDIRYRAYESKNYFLDIEVNYNNTTSRIENGNLFPFYLNFVEANKKYTYENIINCNGISKIEINFDIPINESFNYDLDFLSTFSSDLLAKPYFEYVDDFDTTTITQIDDFIGAMEDTKSTDIEGNEIYQYSGHMGVDWLGLKSLKIVIDVSNYGDYEYYLNLSSTINFNVNTISIVDEIDYMTTINLEGKYGVYLIPKTLNQDVFQNISLYGNYNIEVRKNYVSDESYEVDKSYKNYSDSNFQIRYTFLDLHYLIYFENANYINGKDSGYYITFDNRYFNYAIKEFSYSEPTIINPNTNEELNIKEKIDDINSNDIKGFIKSISYYIEQFSNIIKYYFNSLPSMIRSCIVALFILLLIVSAILLGRGKK